MKKGFTLVELLGVLTVLTIILVFAVPSITRSLKQADNNRYSSFTKEVKESAELYIQNHRDEFPTLNEVDGFTLIKVENLVQNGYLEASLVDPNTGEAIDQTGLIEVSVNGDWTFSYVYPTTKVACNISIATDSSYVENGIPYFQLTVSNANEGSLIQSNMECIITISNQEDSNALYSYLDDLGNSSDYQSSLKTVAYEFKDTVESRTLKVFTKKAKESETSESIAFKVQSAYLSALGTLTLDSDNTCVQQGYSLAQCVLYHEGNSTNLEGVKTNIQAKGTPDFSVTSPSGVYSSKEEKGVTGSVASINKNIYFSEEKPTLDSATGNYYFSSGRAVSGAVKNYVSTGTKRYYTCLTTTATCAGTKVYVIYDYILNGSTYTITKADRYSSVYGASGASNPGLYYDNDSGTYYFRGNVKNNYVSFAGYIWRIVSLKDFSVRLVYSGTSTSATGASTSIGTYAYNASVRDMAYLGYQYNLNKVMKHTNNTLMYNAIGANTNYYFSDSYSCNETTKACTLNGNKISGTWAANYNKILNGDGTNSNYKYTCWTNNASSTCVIITELVDTIVENGVVSTTKANVKYHGFLSESVESTYGTTPTTLKTAVDNWYNTNLVNKKDSKGNAYSSYLSSDALFCNDRTIISGDGMTLEQTTGYGPYSRVRAFTPSLSCESRDLISKVGLLTTDEVMMAGGNSSANNTLYYLYTGQDYWTMSPYVYTVHNTNAHVYMVSSTGKITYNVLSGKVGTRPVVVMNSLQKVVSGDGSAKNPYKIIFNGYN